MHLRSRRGRLLQFVVLQRRSHPRVARIRFGRIRNEGRRAESQDAANNQGAKESVVSIHAASEPRHRSKFNRDREFVTQIRARRCPVAVQKYFLNV